MRASAILAAALLVITFVPSAAGLRECIQAYPWSELCEGDVVGFLEAWEPCVEGICVNTDGCLLTFACVDPVIDPFPEACIGGPPCPPEPTGPA